MERLSGLDASFLYLETPQRHMHVVMSTTLDPATVPGGYTFAKVRRLIADRIPLLPVFQRRLVEVPFHLSHPIWVDDPDFDIDFHVRRTAVPRPGGLREFADQVGDIAGRPLDRDRPLWEMWVVEGLADDHIGLVVKVHHSTVDGVSGAELLSVLFDLEPDPAPRDPGPGAPRDTRIPNPVELMAQAVVARTLRPIEMTRDLVRTARGVLDVRRVRIGRSTGRTSARPPSPCRPPAARSTAPSPVAARWPSPPSGWRM